MKTKLADKLKMAALVLSLAAGAPQLFAQLAIPSDGSDGALVVNSDTVIDLSQAVTGNWNDNNAANTGKGIYDPSKWAVVFKYSSVNISGGTVSFANHPTHAPVVWLVSGDVTINGYVSLDGRAVNLNYSTPAEPGPGGFRGATLGMYGFGPGGGYFSFANYSGGYFYDSYSGIYGGGNSYGNEQIVPLIGGSGGNLGSSGGGGGAILIACAGTITINGGVHANGNSSAIYSYYYGHLLNGGASGGAIRLIASQLTGNGTISVAGVDNGRIRLEATNAPNLNFNLTGGGNPLAVLVSPFPLTLWPAASSPTVQVLTVSNVNANVTAPVDPKAAISGGSDDLAIATTNAVTIRLQTANFPTNGIVNVYLKSLIGGQTVLPASYVSGNGNSATWQLVTTLPVNHTVIQARAVLP